MAGILPTVATPSSAMVYGQSSCDTTPSLTDVRNIIMVTMLGDGLQRVNAGMQGSDAMTSTNDSFVQSILQHIQQLESSITKNMMLHRRIADLETQAYQDQYLAAGFQKQETNSSNVAVGC